MRPAPVRALRNPFVPDSYRPSFGEFGGASPESAIMAFTSGDSVKTFIMNIIDLRQASVRQLEPLLLEEASHWREELHWDYRSALELIKRFLDAHALSGCVALDHDSAIGYAFYVLEDYKGLIGGLYVSPRQKQEPIGRRLLDEMLYSMRALPQMQRIEAQLMPFGGPVEEALREQGFRLHARQFMLLDLTKHNERVPGINSGLRLDRWNDRYFESCAKLIYLAYANHIDGDINDQYRSRHGALKFLKNIIHLPGCGQFLPNASFVLRHPGSDELVGTVLTSEVAAGTGHTTQICVQPGFQGHGLGRMLMHASEDALRNMRYKELSLTVTAENRTAVQLYEKLGFNTIKIFTAGVWPR
jgi:ribosomal protein S18 acetylase RimI-like enzyme